MKNKYAWLILGIVIGIVVSIAACWIWCCSCNSSCATSCGGKCVHLVGADSLKEIPVDSAKLILHPAVAIPDTSGSMKTRTMSMSTVSSGALTSAVKAFMVNRQVLAAMNTLASNPLATSFRVYIGYSGSTISSVYVVGVNSSGRDITSPVYTVSSTTGVGPCPDICDTSSPLY